jgi:hypothetical protein
MFRATKHSCAVLSWVAIALVLSTGAFPAAAPDGSKVRKQLDEHLKRCTEIHRYDPESASDLGPHTLGKGEREWRECVYQGIEKHLIPKAFAPDAYRQAIGEDRQMTERIAGGRMTRAERRARIEALLEEIDRREEAEAQRKIKEVVRQQQEMMMRRDRLSIMQSLGR